MNGPQGGLPRWGRMILVGAAAIAIVSVGYSIKRDSESDAPLNAAAAPEKLDSSQDPEAYLRALQEQVGSDPKNSEAWQQLGWTYFEMGRYADSARSYRRATALVPGNAVFWSSLGEALVMASDRDPMPADAAAAFDRAIALDPKDPRARYFQAVKRDLRGDHKGAIEDWLALLKDTPPGAPWEKDLRRTIEQAAKIAGEDVTQRLAALSRPAERPVMAGGGLATAAIPGPSRAQMQAAAALPKGQQDAMIADMVEGLAKKLQANPGNIDGWIMLMRSHMTLGETAKATSALQQALRANPGQAERIRAEARSISVPGA